MEPFLPLILVSSSQPNPPAVFRRALRKLCFVHSFETTPCDGRTSNDRSYAGAVEPLAQAVFDLLKRPSARRGPGIVSVDRNVRSKCRCSCVLQFTS